MLFNNLSHRLSSLKTPLIFLIGLCSFCIAAYLWMYYWYFCGTFLNDGDFPGVIGFAIENVWIWGGIPVIGLATTFLFTGLRFNRIYLVWVALFLLVMLLVYSLLPIFGALWLLWSWELFHELAHALLQLSPKP